MGTSNYVKYGKFHIKLEKDNSPITMLDIDKNHTETRTTAYLNYRKSRLIHKEKEKETRSDK